MAVALTLALAAGCVWRPAATPTPWLLLDPTPAPPTVAPTMTPEPTATATLTLTPTATAAATSTLTAPTPTATVAPTWPPLPTATPVPLPTPDGVDRVLPVPILMYHYLSAPPANASAVRRDLSVSPERFRGHLQALRAAGYETISLRELLLALQTGYPLPPRPIIITFDDGYRDNYTQAFPILKQEGMRATFFVVTRTLDDRRPEYLSWGMVMEMHQAGMEFGSHSYEHVALAGQPDAYLVYQLLGSREALEARLNEPVRFFCYPAGSYDARTMQVLHDAHYWGAVTVNYGVNQRSAAPFEIERIRVRGSYDAERLLAVIDAAYRAAPDGVDQRYGIEELMP